MIRLVQRALLPLSLCLGLGLATPTITGCSFVRSSKLATCQNATPPVVDLGLFLVSIAATGFLAAEDEYGYMLATSTLTLGFMLSTFYGFAKYAPPPGMTCVKVRTMR